jgi:MoaA/NifB/PqqE/SkfB family radical SAM enzyme
MNGCIELPLHVCRYAVRRSCSHLILHVTSRCNFRCRHCFVDFSNSSDLSIDVCRSLAQQCGRLLWLDIGGGEPFLLDDLPDIVASFDAAVVMIPTNGFAVDRIIEHTANIIKHSRSRIGLSISIEGHRATNDRIRNTGSYDAAWRCFKELKGRFDIPVKINTVLSSENEDEILDFMADVRARKPDFHSVILLRGKTSDPDVHLPSLEKLRHLIPKILEIQGSYTYGQHPYAAALLRTYHRTLWRLSYDILARQTQVIPCLGGSAHSVVYADGGVAPCEMLPVAGNLSKRSFSEIRASDVWRKSRGSIRRKECWCTHNCALLDSIVFNPLAALPSLLGAGTGERP